MNIINYPKKDQPELIIKENKGEHDQATDREGQMEKERKRKKTEEQIRKPYLVGSFNNELLV